MWCHLSIIPGTTPHCLVNTEGNVNSSGTRSLEPVEIGGSCGAIYLSYLVLHPTALSTQKGISTLKEQGPSSTP